MSRLGRIAAAIGVIGALAGLTVVATGAVGPFDVTFDIALVVGLLAAVQGLRYAFERRRTEYEAFEVADPEDRYAAPVPGAGFDETLATASGTSFRAANTRDAVRDRLQGTALEVVAAARGVDEEAAADLLATGDWTDDPVAAAFLGGGDYPLRTFVDALVRRESRFVLGARRTVAELARLQGDGR